MANPSLNLQRIYVKNSSFATENTPQLFRDQKQLQNSIEMRINHIPLEEENMHEVVLSLQVTTKSEDTTAFVSKVEQAGVFKIENVSEEQLKQITSTYCPHLLYPYVCNMLSQLAISGSFPAVILQPINFDNLYKQREDTESGKGDKAKKTVH